MSSDRRLDCAPICGDICSKRTDFQRIDVRKVMTRMRFWLGGTALMASISSVPASEIRIPEAFHGVWQPTIEGRAPTCSEIDSDTRQTVSADRIDFHEGICAVQTKKAVGKNGIALQLNCEQEDNGWQSRQEWTRRDTGGLRYLNIRSLDAANPYEALYGLCPTLATESVPENSGNSDHNQALCYRDEASSLEIRPRGDGTASIEIDSVQGNAHICSLAGTASRTSDGYQYRARLENGEQCELTVTLDSKGGASLSDKDWTCKQHHCGARAAFEHIEFQSAARIACK